MSPIEKADFESLFIHENWLKHGQSPQKDALLKGASLALVAAFFASILSRSKRTRERKTGIV